MSDNNNKLKCAEYTCHGKSCVLLSWELLNITQDNLHKNIATEEVTCDTLFKQLAAVQVHLSQK